WHQLHHRIEIDDVRSVHLAEDFRIQTRGELAEAGVQQVALALAVDLRVIAARRDVLNLADVDRQDALSSPREEAAQRRIKCRGGALRGRNRALQPAADAVEHGLKPLAAERLEKVVERPDFKRRERVLIIRGGEDDLRLVTDPLNLLEPRRFGKLM